MCNHEQEAGLTKTAWQAYKQIRSEIEGEWTLITSRVSWLMLSQTFLFSALVLGIPKYSSFCEKGDKGGCDIIVESGCPASVANYAHSHIFCIENSVLFPQIPLLGILLSLAVLVSVFAAFRRIAACRAQQDRAVEVIRRCSSEQPASPTDKVLRRADILLWGTQDSGRRPHALGALPPFLLPAAFLVVWLHTLGPAGISSVIKWIVGAPWISGPLTLVFLSVFPIAFRALLQLKTGYLGEWLSGLFKKSSVGWIIVFLIAVAFFFYPNLILIVISEIAPPPSLIPFIGICILCIFIVIVAYRILLPSKAADEKGKRDGDEPADVNGTGGAGSG